MGSNPFRLSSVDIFEFSANSFANSFHHYCGGVFIVVNRECGNGISPDVQAARRRAEGLALFASISSPLFDTPKPGFFISCFFVALAMGVGAHVRIRADGAEMPLHLYTDGEFCGKGSVDGIAACSYLL